MKIILITFLMAAVPLIEQRGAIPFGIINNLSPVVTFGLALAGSLLPVPFILLLFNHIYSWLLRYRFFNRITKIIDSKIAKNRHSFEKYQELALIIFIAIPLPTTGLWTGSAIAAFLKLDFKKSLLCTMIGGTLSASVITLLCVFVPSLFR
ncbi:MAG: small multi-drug export protein [Candidatus Saccharibacteria bacterium]|nr:small multi-drug export protein [Candidatus Saccharibacteria bacterium]